MDDIWIAPDCLFDGQRLLSSAAMRIEDGHIAEIADATGEARPLQGCISPGFVDLQVNGGGDVLLNNAPSRDTMTCMARAHRRFGTVAILPTVITDDPEVLDRAARAAVAARGDSGIIGLHIEGPHISHDKRGTHAGAFIRPLDDRSLDVVARLRGAGVAVMITLAPEAARPEQIAALVALGVVVSLGHTNATSEQVDAAIAAGASCGTHLFNAMSQMQGRAPGAVGAILDSDIHFGVICDGHHVDDRMIRVALRCDPSASRAFLVSDAMATVGGGESFELYGATIRLDEGRLINAENNLAGAHLTQAEGLRRLVEVVGCSLEQVLRMVVTNPAIAIAQPGLAQMVGRSVRDVLILDVNNRVVGPLEDVLSQAH